MREPLFRQALLIVTCIFVAGCSANPDAGTSPPPPSGVSTGTASAVPPSLNGTRSLPAASPNYPTGLSPFDTSSSVKALPLTSAHSNGGANSGAAPSERNSGTTSPSVGDGGLPAAANMDTSNAATTKNEDEADFDNLEIADTGLKGKLSVLRVGSEPTANNLLSVFVGLKNRTSKPLSIEVQTIYKDKLDNPLNEGSWIPMTLAPHESTEYKSASISADATDFLVRIRRASDTVAN